MPKNYFRKSYMANIVGMFMDCFMWKIAKATMNKNNL